jgi:hypothetical protein
MKTVGLFVLLGADYPGRNAQDQIPASDVLFEPFVLDRARPDPYLLAGF